MPTRDHIDPKRVDIDLSELKKTLDEIFEDSKRAQENKEAVKNFVDEMNNEIIPKAEFMVSSLIPLCTYHNEIETAKMIWRCFEQVAALNEPKVNAIIAGEIQKLKKRRDKR